MFGFQKKKIKNHLLLSIIILLFLMITAIILYVFSGLMRQGAVPAMRSLRQGRHTVILDAGHGGLDGGAVSDDGIKESELNLSIALRMEQLSGLLGIPTVLTRTGEELDYPDHVFTTHEKKVWDQKSRVETVQHTADGILISIHQNKYPDSRPSGATVLYAKTAGSKELAEIMQRELVQCLQPTNRRVATPISDSIYLLKKATCPSILVECGFLSNAQETELLKSSAYQKKLAAVLLGAYLQYEHSNMTNEG